jgi:hypothetical protein
MIIAIHQPNYFPWLGFFDKIAGSDLFVLLDHVKNDITAGFWVKRVKVLVHGQVIWSTVPLYRGGNEKIQPINQMIIDVDNHLMGKNFRVLRSAYLKAPYFESVFPLVEAFYQHKSPFIAERNIDFIKSVCEMLGIATKLILSSDLACERFATDLNIEITQKVSGTTYKSGDGSTGYLEDYKFRNAGLNLVFQDFVHPVYSQFNSNHFIPGLSVIDALFNIGPKGTAGLLNVKAKQDKGGS